MKFEIPVPLVIMIITIVLIVVWQIYKRKIQRINQMPAIPRTIPASGFEVPILAAFTGSRKTPRQMSHSHNNINPYLILYDNRLDCRVILKKSISFSEIEKVDIWDTFATRNLQIYVKDREEIFTANLYNKRNLTQVLHFLENRGVFLSDRAKTFKSANNA